MLNRSNMICLLFFKVRIINNTTYVFALISSRIIFNYIFGKIFLDLGAEVKARPGS